MKRRITLPTPRLSHSKGSYVWLENDDEPYLDFIMGFGSVNFGHAHPKIIAAVAEASRVVDTALPIQYGVSQELEQRLVQALPFRGGPFTVSFLESGSLAVEAALEACKVHTGKSKVISFDGAFHGFTMSLSGISDLRFLESTRESTPQQNNIKIPFPLNEKQAESVLATLEKLVTTHNDISAILLETCQGGAGYRMAPDSFFRKLQSIIEKTDIILIVDDILMGIGRTGHLYSFSPLHLRPDIVLLGKSLAGGYYPLSALIIRSDILESVSVPVSSLASTFSNNPFGIYIANEVQKIIKEDSIYDNVWKVAPLFLDLLESLHAQYPKKILGYNGWGLSGGLELKSRSAVEEALGLCLEEHLLAQYAGTNREYLRFNPSLLSSKKEFESAYTKLSRVFEYLR